MGAREDEGTYGRSWQNLRRIDRAGGQLLASKICNNRNAASLCCNNMGFEVTVHIP